MLIEAIKPICGRGIIYHLLTRNCVRYEDGDGMTDEHVALLDITPQEVPDIGLWRAWLGDEIAANLNMRSVQDRAIWRQLLDHGNQARHLRVIDLLLLLEDLDRMVQSREKGGLLSRHRHHLPLGGARGRPRRTSIDWRFR